MTFFRYLLHFPCRRECLRAFHSLLPIFHKHVDVFHLKLECIRNLSIKIPKRKCMLLFVFIVTIDKFAILFSRITFLYGFTARDATLSTLPSATCAMGSSRLWFASCQRARQPRGIVVRETSRLHSHAVAPFNIVVFFLT